MIKPERVTITSQTRPITLGPVYASGFWASCQIEGMFRSAIPHRSPRLPQVSLTLPFAEAGWPPSAAFPTLSALNREGAVRIHVSASVLRLPAGRSSNFYLFIFYKLRGPDSFLFRPNWQTCIICMFFFEQNWVPNQLRYTHITRTNRKSHYRTRISRTGIRGAVGAA